MITIDEHSTDEQRIAAFREGAPEACEGVSDAEVLAVGRLGLDEIADWIIVKMSELMSPMLDPDPDPAIADAQPLAAWTGTADHVMAIGGSLSDDFPRFRRSPFGYVVDAEDRELN